MVSAFLNVVSTAVPDFDMHAKFVEYCPGLLTDRRSQLLFQRMAQRTQIEHRYSVLQPHAEKHTLDTEDFFASSGFPSTGKRMTFYERHAFHLAKRALDRLELDGTSHLIITSCTGFYAPGLDLQIVHHYGLSASVERTVVGFMGCYAAMNALKLARHIVRSDNEARILIVNLELCTLHLQQSGTLEEMLSFLIFADGCAASIVSATPQGLELQSFSATVLPATAGQITWHIGELGFDMHLSGMVPSSIAAHLPSRLDAMLDGQKREDIAHWAIHPGGRSILDAVRDGAELEEQQLAMSRDILRRFGNMSSPTIMFVLAAIMEDTTRAGPGCAMAFGPGLTVESMRFQSQPA
jgi:alpha-pyrone synthase